MTQQIHIFLVVGRIDPFPGRGVNVPAHFIKRFLVGRVHLPTSLSVGQIIFWAGGM